MRRVLQEHVKVRGPKIHTHIKTLLPRYYEKGKIFGYHVNSNTTSDVATVADQRKKSHAWSIL